jgi:hypothetical protein
MRFILGPLIIALGIAMMKYSFWITQQTGKFEFAEKYLPAPLSGTYSWWKLVGFAFIVLACLWMGGFLDFDQATTTPGI